MTMYDELVKQCRDCIECLCGECKYEHLQTPGNFVTCMNALLGEAADAIEELSMKLHGDEAAIAGMQREIERMVVYGNKPRWIPVTERLPDLDEDVQILFPNNQAAGFYNGCSWCIYTGDTWYSMVGEDEVTPTHWAKKLPEPPEEET